MSGQEAPQPQLRVAGAEPEGKPAPARPAYKVDPVLRREHRRRRFRRHRRRAYIRSMYSLPTLATLGNAICGFAAMYIAALDPTTAGRDPITTWMAAHSFTVSAYLIFLAMIFDGLDGRLARFTRHTTDFGGQLDSLADVISFGAAPALLAIQVFKHQGPDIPFALSRLIWAIGALFMSCAALRLARFNVSNEHGEQHHFSFLGLPSPGAAGAVAGWVLMQQDLLHEGVLGLAAACVWALPLIVLLSGLLMVTTIRYPHLVNRYLRGKRSLGRILSALIVGLALVVWHQYTLGLGMLAYTLWGVTAWAYARVAPAPGGGNGALILADARSADIDGPPAIPPPLSRSPAWQ